MDAQILPIAEIGRTLGVLAPVTARMVELTHEIEEGKCPLDFTNLEEMATISA